jgi:putative ABC transport system permease protein
MLALFVSVSFLWFSSAIRYRGVVVLIVALFGILYARFGLSLQIFFIVISVCFPVVFFYGLTKVLLRLGRLRANHSIAVRGLRPLTWVMRRADQPWSSMIVIGTVFSLLLCVLWTVAMIQYAFIDYLQDFQATDQPNTFILNITESTRSLVQTSLPDAQFYDTILARILRVNEVWLRDYLDQRWMPYWRFSREFNMTTVSLADEIAWWSATLLPWMISVDSDTAADLWIRIGDMLTLWLVGREFVLRVGQLRNVERSQLQPFFFFQLHPDDMVGAPRTYFSLVSLDPGDRPEVLRLLLAQTSGQLSFIEVDAIVDQIKQLVLVVVGSMSVVGMSILVIGFVLALLCMITVLDEQKRDGVLLQLLGVTNSWVSRACIFALWYPIVLVVLSSLLVLGILWLLFSSMQSFIPLTWFHILWWMVVVCLFLWFFMLLVVLTRFRSLLR